MHGGGKCLITIPSQIGIQANELRAVYPALELFGKPSGPWKIIGPLRFTATYNNETLTKTIPVIISIPSDFPKKLPTVKEHLSSLITCFPHVNADDKSFCLGTPIDLKIRFSKVPTLLFFVEEFLIPFLYSAFYWLENGVMPFPDRDHGPLGLLQEYCSLFQVHDPKVVMSFLHILSNKQFVYEKLCPCGSAKKLNECHATILKNISAYQTSSEFEYDWHSINDLRKIISFQHSQNR